MLQELQLKVIGSGGAFNPREGNSSFVISRAGSKRKYLVDCGSTVYAELKKFDLVDKIDYVCITHLHDDHIGSLSTFIFDRWFLHQKRTIILTHPKVTDTLTNYLLKIVNVPQDLFWIGYGHSSAAMKIRAIDTTDFHYKGMPSCAFLFEGTEGEEFGDSEKIVISGDTGLPIWDAEEFPPLSYFDPNRTLILHDVTNIVGDGSIVPFPHCHYSALEEMAGKFYVFGYHNSLEQEDEISANSNINSVRMIT